MRHFVVDLVKTQTRKMDWKKETIVGCETRHATPPALVSQLAVFEFENFRGKKVELSGECKEALEKIQRVGSVIVESGPWVNLVSPWSSCFYSFEHMCTFTLIVMKCLCIVRWVGFERPGFAGEQFVLEKGEYPRWSTWTNCQSSYTLTSFRPLKVVSNH